VSAEELLRRYLEQRREMGERDLTLDDLTVDEVLRILGARGARKPRESTVTPRAERSADARPTEQPSTDEGPPPFDWRSVLRDAESAPPRRLADSGAKAAPAGTPAPTQVPAVVLPPTGLVVGGNETELFGGPIGAAESVAEIARLVSSCQRCDLYRSATHPVPGEGDPRAGLMCVGEAPGASEDATGRPFVGQAGQLLTKILEAIQLTREQVFIVNVLKHRPPGNRNPRPEEVIACRPFLVRQIELIRPKVIVAFGTFAAQSLLDTKFAIGRLRGAIHRYHGIPVIVTYHPAALLRNPNWKRPTWEDVQLARRILDLASA